MKRRFKGTKYRRIFVEIIETSWGFVPQTYHHDICNTSAEHCGNCDMALFLLYHKTFFWSTAEKMFGGKYR